jgi:low affinity Fe/Cu permease
MKVDDLFSQLAKKTARHAGHTATFILAVAVVLLWVVTGPVFQWSDSWQLVINTGTTIVTFLMVFLIQNTQNNDSKAMQLKLDELIRATEARNSFLCIENLSEDEMDILREGFLLMLEHTTQREDIKASSSSRAP